MPDWLSIIVGLIALIVTADILVRGAVGIALALGISKFMVGLTIIAFGTSAPELVVALVDVLRSDEALRSETSVRGAIAIGTVFGSNIANIGLILGLTAAFRPIPVVGTGLRAEAAWLVFVTACTFLPVLQGDQYSRLAGGVLVGSLLTFTIWLIRREQRTRRLLSKPREEEEDDDPERVGRRFTIYLAFVLIGLAGLRAGAGWLVTGCSGLASDLGLSEGMISATVVAIGSSLPELATSVVSARRGHPELVLGNIVGSNVFNVGLVLGTTALIHPIPIDWDDQGFRLGIGMLMTVILAGLMVAAHRIGRVPGILLLAGYVGFLVFEGVRAA